MATNRGRLSLLCAQHVAHPVQVPSVRSPADRRAARQPSPAQDRPVWLPQAELRYADQQRQHDLRNARGALLRHLHALNPDHAVRHRPEAVQLRCHRHDVAGTVQVRDRQIATRWYPARIATPAPGSTACIYRGPML